LHTHDTDIRPQNGSLKLVQKQTPPVYDVTILSNKTYLFSPRLLSRTGQNVSRLFDLSEITNES